MQRPLEQIDESIARYLSQLDSADRQGPTVPEAKIMRLNEKIATLRDEIQRLKTLNARMIQRPVRATNAHSRLPQTRQAHRLQAAAPVGGLRVISMR